MPNFKTIFSILKLQQLFILCFLSLSVFSNLHAKEPDGDIDFVVPFINIASTISNSGTGYTASATLQSSILLNATVSRTQIENEAISNAYIGVIIPNFFALFFGDRYNLFDNIVRTHFILNTGSGDRGRTSQFGIAHVAGAFDKKKHHKILISYIRETYQDYSDYNNNQFGLTYAYLTGF